MLLVCGSCATHDGDAAEADTEEPTAGGEIHVKECADAEHFVRQNYAPLGGPYKDMIAGDVDGDGHQDLVVAGENVVVYRNRGGGVLDDRTPFHSGHRIDSAGSFVALTDWNRDGRPDIVAVSPAGDVKLFEQDRSMSFVQVAETTTHEAAGIAVADMNGDGREDIVVFGVGITVWSAPAADGRLGEPWTVVEASRAARGGAVADVDADGNPDVVVVSWNPDELMMLAHGDGRGGFDRTSWYPSPSPGDIQGADAAVADVDGDGLLDVVVAGRSWPQDQPVLRRKAQVVWLRGIGHGQLEQAAVFSPPRAQHVQALSLDDLDHDGLPEIIVYSPGYTYYRTIETTTETIEIPGGLHFAALRDGELQTVAPGFLDARTLHGNLLVMDVNGDGLHDLIHMSRNRHLWWGCR